MPLHKLERDQGNVESLSDDIRVRPTDSLVECAYKICTLFHRNNKEIVLTGGSSATVYSKEAYMSSDIDFVLNFWGDSSKENLALESMGFVRGQTYRHEKLPYTLDFIDDHLAVGQKRISQWATLYQGNLILNILTPTDCVLDRLSSAIHWNDRSALNQAMLVAKNHHIDWEEVEAWCANEDFQKGPECFNRLKGLLR